MLMPQFEFLRGAECPICIESLLSNAPAATPSSTDVGASGDLNQVGDEVNFPMRVWPNGAFGWVGNMPDAFVAAVSLYRLGAGRARLAASSSETSGALEGIAVLPCGHLLHFTCAMQLYEYKTGAQCPICRHPLKRKSDILCFHPQCRRRAGQQQGEVVVDMNNAGSSETDVAHDVDDEVCITGQRQCPPTEAYVDRLKREVKDLMKRCRNLNSRELNLANSQQQLEDQCIKLQDSLGRAQNRYNALTQNGTVGVERLQKLRTVALETYNSVESLTRELADATREKARQHGRIAHYAQKLDHCRKRCGAGDTDCRAPFETGKPGKPDDFTKVHEEALHPKKKPRL
ncbi:Ring finger domain containing protein, putative [Trypanosoma equiperdum]|uniref:RING-type domain-containing protein n=4 Tax=Trypanozoon TaxID=39700 RepID=Q57VS3_TRYB2|nr:hypothetical protein, conserved [Trypanosoma brucei gambiense DAL972]XP_845701.1 hypothetical protein, conserved [Trypanosoma brucei brucei TREU927]AAX70295.1 hypothetical protein, conserved [Trypanosoma brucei]RHW71731.1 Ring finger domain containing protein [Trypanosoma brucei equiperdum]SCU65959.1 Ring finger domain containing protein, putative [Trypanosoma equiperdum]AAZ12142.1 hypothetical protein, conserved [Trypanosoma brucei brucei TREU927]CBH12094.1 hypothetical protein, conserved|eukprot:XP_011774377.1 hypothetical protein, conserved [Trypanosoma brucei gambiense DAL972]